ncbi:LytTR family transcriptional regulator, partial [bacterium]|nr:LytTR family transcriptional regulator [bacterium]
GKQIIYVRDIVYFTTANRNTYAVTEDARYTVTAEMKDLEKQLKGLFVRTHSYYLVKVSKVTHISRRYPKTNERDLLDTITRASKECELHLEGMKETVPVTETHYKRVREVLGIRNFAHLIPDNPIDKKFRELEILQFGWRDLDRLDANDPEAVEEHLEKWDIKRFDRPKALIYFRQVGELELDKRKFIKNIIYQLYQFIKKGIEPVIDGNIRTLWYRIKAVLAYHSNSLTPGDVDTFYNVLTEMVESYMVFKYKDFGFMDVNEPYRGIGSTRPEIILASEKIGHFHMIMTLAEKVGASFMCMKGEPAHISLEYFSDDLMDAIGNQEKSVYVISDIDPAGHSIENNFIEGLEKHGHVFKTKVSLIDLDIYDEGQIGYDRIPVVRYEIKDDEIIPIPPASMGTITRATNWFDNVIQDDRLKSISTDYGKKIVTIWGMESDAAEREYIRKRFLDAVG